MFDICFEDEDTREDKKRKWVWQNSWGLSTRTVKFCSVIPVKFSLENELVSTCHLNLFPD